MNANEDQLDFSSNLSLRDTKRSKRAQGKHGSRGVPFSRSNQNSTWKTHADVESSFDRSQ